MTASATSIQCGEIQLERNQEMPFANFKTPEAALTKAQMEDLVLRVTLRFVGQRIVIDVDQPPRIPQNLHLHPVRMQALDELEEDAATLCDSSVTSEPKRG